MTRGLKVRTGRWGRSRSSIGQIGVRFIRSTKPTEYPAHLISQQDYRPPAPLGHPRVSLGWGFNRCSWASAESVHRIKVGNVKLQRPQLSGRMRMSSFQQDHVCRFNHQIFLSTAVAYSIAFSMWVCRHALYLSRWRPWHEAGVITDGETDSVPM